MRIDITGAFLDAKSLGLLLILSGVILLTVTAVYRLIFRIDRLKKEYKVLEADGMPSGFSLKEAKETSGADADETLSKTKRKGRKKKACTGEASALEDATSALSLPQNDVMPEPSSAKFYTAAEGSDSTAFPEDERSHTEALQNTGEIPEMVFPKQGENFLPENASEETETALMGELPQETETSLMEEPLPETETALMESFTDKAHAKECSDAEELMDRIIKEFDMEETALM